MQTLVNGQLSITAEYNIPLGSIKYVGMTNLRDDWFCLGVGSPNTPDPLISCVFKTELITRLKKANPAGFEIRIGPTIEYSKKPGKLAVIKSMKDPTVPRDDLYKSSTIHVGPGEPPNSTSKPTPKGKQLAAKPITTGKLLRPGGPSGGPAKNRPTAARPIPQEARLPQPRAAQQTINHPVNHTVNHPTAPVHPTPIVRKPLASVAATHNRAGSSGSSKGPPPPPPPPPAAAASSEPMAQAKFEFNGQSDKEMSVAFDEVVELLRKEENGWWLVKRVGAEEQGWAPSAYLKEIIVAKKAPPPPPRPNGVGKAKPPAPPKRPGVAGNPDRNSGGAGAGSSGASTSGESFAGGLAEAVSIPNPIALTRPF